MNNKIKGYKVFNSDWTCRGFQYEIGKTYELEGELEVCENGFHYCNKLVDCFGYYDFDLKNKVAVIEALGEVKTEKNKSATDKIKIVKEITWDKVLEMVNTGDDNTGYGNTGNHNTGDWNTGRRNAGERNTGNRNTGDWNIGNWNRGYFNSDTPTTIRVFNKECEKIIWDKAKKPKFLYFNLVEWVWESEMTEEEKNENPDYKVANGYLKTFSYKEAFKKSFYSLNKVERKIQVEQLKKLPNFDAEIFYQISGININKLDDSE